MRNVLSSTLLAIVVAFALLGAATSPAYADGPDEFAPAALPDAAAPSLPVVFTDEEPVRITPIVFTDTDPAQVLAFVPEAVGAVVDMFDPGDPGLPPD
jgi:hypothetical protein